MSDELNKHPKDSIEFETEIRESEEDTVEMELEKSNSQKKDKKNEKNNEKKNEPVKKEKIKKSRNFCFTMYKISEDQSDKLGKLVEDAFARTLFFTHEMGSKDENPHIQGFISCHVPNSLTNVKNKLNSVFDEPPNPHVEIARGTAYENFIYCTKELKENPYLKHVVFGEGPLPPGKKRDDSKFESYVALLAKGEIKLSKIMDDDIAHYVRHENLYLSVNSKLRRKALSPPTFVAWFSGTSGAGKSYTANKIAEELGFDVYEAGCDNEFFNPYQGEDCSIWDDYRSTQLRFAQLLKITDRAGTMINVKGTKVFFNPKIQIFTSPDGIESARTSDMKNNKMLDNMFSQLERRISLTAKFVSSDTTGLPEFETVKESSRIVIEKFKSVYKQHLIDSGFENYIDLIPALKDVVPTPSKRLIPYRKDIKITVEVE